MTFSDYVRSKGKKTYTPTSLKDLFVTEYITDRFMKDLAFIKDKDYTEAENLGTAAAHAYGVTNDVQAKQGALRGLLQDLDALAEEIARRVAKRALKAQADKEGRNALAQANTQVPLAQQIQGDRVLHFTTAFAAIVKSDKLRISATSDQGCVFCIPARYAPYIAQEPPATVKQWFDIRQDLSHYVEFNLENSRNFESYNSHIDEGLKGQKELKVNQEILNLSRRNPQWYEWKGKASGGWALVPGPYNWGK